MKCVALFFAWILLLGQTAPMANAGMPVTNGFMAIKSPSLTVTHYEPRPRVGKASAGQHDIVRNNTVGYYKVTLPPYGGRQLIGLNLFALDPTNQTLLGILGTQLSSSLFPNSADHVLLWNENGTFSTYGRKSSDGLYYSTGDWAGPATNPILRTTSSFWIESGPAATTNKDLVIMGSVFENAFTNVTVHAGFQPLAYPFSCDMDVQSWGLTNGTAAASYGGSDHLWVWSGTNLTYSTYVLRPGGAWTALTANASYSIAMGDGFWYFAQTNFVWTETNLYYGNL